MTTLSPPALRLGDRELPVILPSRRDPRLHTAAVIISIHVIGITALGFRVSVPQILAAIVAAAAVDIAVTLWRTGQLVWPASGMLTGSGVALILRLTGMPSGDYWSWTGWHYFALIAGISVVTKYVIRFRGSHVFNPSNVGLVAAFLLLGSSVIEPLDFWWAPMGFWMALAYVIIVGGGILITRRLNLLEMAITYWVVLAAGLAVLSASGHCMTAAWSVDPVCDFRFWSVLVTSPEILVFLLFMITDPKTVPSGRLARVAFAGTLGIATTLLMAPQAVEFGAKVALLGSLVIWSPLRGLFDRLVPDPRPDRSGIRSLLDRVMDRERRPFGAFAWGAIAGSSLVVLASAIIAAGAPARTPATTVAVPVSPEAVGIEIDAESLPEVEVDPAVHGLSADIDDEYVADLAVNLAENLAMESQAIRSGDGSLLGAADGGERLTQMQAELDEALATGERATRDYEFEALALDVAETRGEQSGAALEFAGTGTVEEVVFDAFGTEVERSESAFQSRFVMRQLGGDRWLLVEVAPFG